MQADDARDAGSQPRACLCAREAGAGAVVQHGDAAALLVFAQLRETLSAAEAPVRMARVDEALRPLRVQRKPLGLDVRPESPDVRKLVWAARRSRPFVMREATERERSNELFGGSRDEPCLVRVFDSQDERPAVLLCKQIVVQSRAEATEVQIARRRGRVANPDGPEHSEGAAEND